MNKITASSHLNDHPFTNEDIDDSDIEMRNVINTDRTLIEPSNTL